MEINQTLMFNKVSWLFRAVSILAAYREAEHWCPHFFSFLFAFSVFGQCRVQDTFSIRVAKRQKGEHGLSDPDMSEDRPCSTLKPTVITRGGLPAKKNSDWLQYSGGDDSSQGGAP